MLDFSPGWKAPVTLLLQRVEADVMSAAAKPPNLSWDQLRAVRTLAGFLHADPRLPHPAAADCVRVPPAVFQLPPSFEHEQARGGRGREK